MAARGIRNNNPLNIRKGNNWQGERHPQTDAAFEEFENMTMGIRAAMVIVRNYISRRPRIDTPRTIISRWAPPTENVTTRYVDWVCTKANLQADISLKWSEKNKICRLLWAMAQYECGQEVSFQYFENAYELACR